MLMNETVHPISAASQLHLEKQEKLFEGQQWNLCGCRPVQLGVGLAGASLCSLQRVLCGANWTQIGG